MISKIAVIIQARMTSTRLPGKILLPLAGISVLERVVRRCRKATLANAVVVASPEGKESQPIEDLCRAIDVPFFQGSEDDVLDRYYQAAKWINADAIVRVTSDCPLIEPALIDAVISKFSIGNETGLGFDYLSNLLSKRTFPRGLDAEIFSMRALETAHVNARYPYDREHVTTYIYKTRPQDFVLGSLESHHDLSRYRLTLDTEEDYKMFEALFARFADKGIEEPFLPQVIAVLREFPEIEKINAGVVQKSH